MFRYIILFKGEREILTEGKLLLLACENKSLKAYGLHSRKKASLSLIKTIPGFSFFALMNTLDVRPNIPSQSSHAWSPTEFVQEGAKDKTWDLSK